MPSECISQKSFSLTDLMFDVWFLGIFHADYEVKNVTAMFDQLPNYIFQ